MTEGIRIDKELFSNRLSQFLTAWKADKRANDAWFGGVGAIVVLLGKTEESNAFPKNNAIHFWLLGYEFPASLFLFTPDKFYVVTTSKKAKHLEPLKEGKIPVEVLVRGKDAGQNMKLFEKIVEIIKESGKKLGVIAKDTSSGPFIDEWRKVYDPVAKELEEFDIAPALSEAALAIKDEHELRAMRAGSKAAAGLMNPWFADEMADILDEEKKVKHSALADKVEGKIDDAKFFKDVPKLPNDFDSSALDWSYGPIVQSGGKYDLKLSARPDDDYLHAGVIIACFGLRYRTYCSILVRTYLVDPDKVQEDHYKFLIALHQSVMQDLRDGAVLGDVYSKAVKMIQAKKPDLGKHFAKSLGSGIGIELRDQTLNINGKNTRIVKDGMTFCVATAFNDIPNASPRDKRSATYTLAVSDTVRVTRAEPVIFTASAPSEPETISFFFKDEDDVPAPKIKEKKAPRPTLTTDNITRTKLRGARNKEKDEGAEARRREHQKELAKKNQEAGLERYAGTASNQNGATQKTFKRFESYKRENQFPTKVSELLIVVDTKNSTLVLPIMGRPVPFHINTIKNASKSDEGEYAYLRINFLSPGQGVGRKDDQPFEDPSAQFVRSLTFRSKDADRMEDIAQQITELRKAALRREQEKKDMEDVVEQDKLVEVRNRRPPRLSDVYIRPATDGKRVPGEVEIHQNGLRYHSPLRPDQRVDILFNNVKHLFFQPSVHELIVIIHVHLRNPIVVGKKKTQDVQFYRDATDIQFDETGHRKRKHRFDDEEEFEAEQEERRRRAALDKEFKSFAEKISEAGRNENVSVDIPYRELGFQGVPNRANVLMQPSTDCLVQLTDPPFFVVTLDEIEAAHLERVQFGLKNFDLVLIFKDFQRTPVHINTIPVESLEAVKDWLDSINIPISEGPLNLNWGTIMKTVTSDPHQFFIDGGWSVLGVDSDAEGEDDEEEESAFELSESEMAASEESSEEDSEFDEDASNDEGSEGGMDDDEDDDGEDWDEMEKNAERKDRESALEEGAERNRTRGGGAGRKRKR
ncbi:MAG: FACT complex subunit spt16 [Watsoniomyces obsoletus]|nr:MAG: FACT complex subunit spt16 [Watsoniomyces obsoletus]